MTSKQTGVVYIQRHKFQLFLPILPEILEFRYVPEIVHDMDIVDEDLFEGIIKLFIDNTKIPPSSLIFILADNAGFTKDFNAEAPKETPGEADDARQTFQEKVKEQEKDFIDNTPFDNVGSKSFPIGSGTRVFTTNKDLYEFIKKAFEKEKFVVEGVFPGFVLGDTIGASPELTAQMANLILGKVNSVHQYNMLRHEDRDTIKNAVEAGVEVEEKIEKPKTADPKDKKKLFALIGVFIFLIVVLVIVYFMNYPLK